MAATAVIRARDATSKARRAVDVTLDNSYPTGGYALTPQQLGLGSGGAIEHVNVMGTADGYLYKWNPATNKLMVFQGDNANAAAAPGTEVANASAALNNKVVRLEVVGTGHG